MVIGIILALVFIVLTIVGLAVAVSLHKKGKRGLTRVAAGFTVLMVLCLCIFPLSFHTIDTGELAVVKHLGEARTVRSAGTHFDLWITESYQRYDAKVQNVEINTAAYSSDAQTMDFQMTLQYQIMSDKVMNIAKQYGSLDILENRIQSIAIEKTKAVLSSYKAMNIISDRAAMSPMVEGAIKDAIGEEYFVNVTAVVLTNIDFSEAFEQAVEEKMIAEQKQLKAAYENETKIAQAEADAKAKVVAAEAEAKANELLERSLTEKILREMYIDKWDGKLPSVVAGDESTSIMIPSSSVTE